MYLATSSATANVCDAVTAEMMKLEAVHSAFMPSHAMKPACVACWISVGAVFAVLTEFGFANFKSHTCADCNVIANPP